MGDIPGQEDLKFKEQEQVISKPPSAEDTSRSNGTTPLSYGKLGLVFFLIISLGIKT